MAQKINEMTKTELKENITKINKLLRSDKYEAGIELIKTRKYLLLSSLNKDMGGAWSATTGLNETPLAQIASSRGLFCL